MVNVFSYATTNVTSGAYVTIVASTSLSCGQIVIVDTSTQLIKLAVGAAGSEVDVCAFQGNGSPVSFSIYLAAGSRLSLKAVNTSGSTGYNCVSFTG